MSWKARLVFLALMMAASGTASAATAPMGPKSPRNTIDALSAAVNAIVADTRPQHWPLMRACLYYAIGGQALLAEAGIPARLGIGRVVYWPGTAAAHPIAPHAWLETATHFIDYAMLPRVGGTAIISRRRVASMPFAVVPGFTRVLAIPTQLDLPLFRYLSHHHRRFYSRWAADLHRQSGLLISPFQSQRVGTSPLKKFSGCVDRESIGNGDDKQQCRPTVP